MTINSGVHIADPQTRPQVCAQLGLEVTELLSSHISVNEQATIDWIDIMPEATGSTEHHWFVPDDHGLYCRACGLPQGNRRHVERAQQIGGR